MTQKITELDQKIIRDMDAEATEFAMHLLMPDDLLIPDVQKMGGVDIEDSDKVAKLARKYRVSIQVITLRLGMLMEDKLPTPPEAP